MKSNSVRVFKEGNKWAAIVQGDIKEVRLEACSDRVLAVKIMDEIKHQKIQRLITKCFYNERIL